MTRIPFALGLAVLAITSCQRAATAAPVPNGAAGDAPADRALCFSGTAPRAMGAVDERVELLVARGQAWVRQARNSGDPGFYLHADACAKLALATAPDTLAALSLRSLALLNDHRFHEAKALAEAMLAKDPDDLGAWAALSDALLELGDVDGAARAAQQLMDRKPSLPSYARASYLLWLRGDIAGALQASAWAFDAGRGQQDHEPSAWVLSEAATIFLHQGDLEGAERGFAMALAEKADFAPALIGKARCLLARGDAVGASRLLEQALAHAPSVEAAWLLSSAHTVIGDAAAATQALAQAKALGRAGDRRSLALLLASRNEDLEEARRLLDDEATVRGGVYLDDVQALLALREGDLASANMWSARALALGTPDPRLQLHRGLILWNSGDASGKSMVAAALAQGLQHDPALVALANEVMK